MDPRHQVWRQRLWLWLPALLFFLLNLGVLSVYHLAFAGRSLGIRGQIERRTAEAAELEARRLKLEGLYQSARSTEEKVTSLYDSRFSTERDRLTRVIAEVKDLARRAGLQPDTITYPEEQIEDYGLVKRSFVFTVEGTYDGFRRFLNLLELSDSFLTVEQVSLSEGGDRTPGLRIALGLSTLFKAEPAAVTKPVEARPATTRPEPPPKPRPAPAAAVEEDGG